VLEQEVRRRAVEGIEEAVYSGGEQVGTVRRFSDRLLALLMRARKPDEFGDKLAVSGELRTGAPTVIEVRHTQQLCPHGETCPLCAAAGRPVLRLVQKPTYPVPRVNGVPGWSQLPAKKPRGDAPGGTSP